MINYFPPYKNENQVQILKLSVRGDIKINRLQSYGPVVEYTMLLTCTEKINPQPFVKCWVLAI